MLEAWIQGNAREAHILIPIELVVLQVTVQNGLVSTLQAINSMGISHLTQLHNGSRQFVGCQTKRQGWRQPPHQSLKRNGDWSLVSKDEESVITRERHTGSSDVGSVAQGGEQPGTAPIERLR